MATDAYRNDRGPLEERKAELHARIEELRDLDGQKREAVRELADIEKRLGDLHKRTLPMLDRVSVASPCSVPWQEMKGDDRVRFCGQCSKNVFNLSAMSRDEATAFVSSVEPGGACIRFYKRADGTMLTADCPVGVRRRRRRRIIGLAVGAVGALGLATTAFATIGKKSPEVVVGALVGPHEEVQGGLAPWPEPEATQVKPQEKVQKPVPKRPAR